MTTPIDVPLTTDEPVASVLRILRLTEDAEHEDTFTAHSLPQVRRVYGGQVIAQSLLASMATIDQDDRLPHSFHAYFLRGGDPEAPFTLHVNRLRNGRSFSSRSVTCRQSEREILTLAASFQGPESGLTYDIEAPDVPGPDSCDSALELFRMMNHPVGRFLGKTAAFDVRHVQDSLYVKPDPHPTNRQQLWMRPRSPVPSQVSQLIHRALLAYVVDQVMLEPAMRATSLCWMTPGLSAASLDHAMWFHHDVDINDWLLFDGTCTNVNSGRVLTHMQIFSSDGRLVADANQQGMMRVPSGGVHGSGRWEFMDGDTATVAPA